jgi:homocysteine S-methyltransferase
LEQPQLIKQVHRDYFDAGAEIAITSSYQATPQGFAGRGIAEAEALELVALSVRLADEARSEHLAEDPDAGPLLIAGSVGPYGAYLADGSEYRGDYVLAQREFKEFHHPRIGALVEARVDLLACETLPSFAEAEALLALVPDDTAGYRCCGNVDEALASRSGQNVPPPVSPSGYSRWSWATLGSSSSAP